MARLQADISLLGSAARIWHMQCRSNSRTLIPTFLLSADSWSICQAVSRVGAIAVAAADSSGSVGGGSTTIHIDAEDGVTNASGSAAEGLFPRALAALRLTRLFAARMTATLDPAQLRAQVYARGKTAVGDAGLIGDDASDSGDGPGTAVGGGSGGGGRRDGKSRAMPGATPSKSGVATVLTEGREEAENGLSSTDRVASGGGGGSRDNGDVVLALLASLVSLCVSDSEGGSAPSQSAPSPFCTALGFGDVQLEGVSLLLVLLGTQVYGRPPSDQATDRQGQVDGQFELMYAFELFRLGREVGWGSDTDGCGNTSPTRMQELRNKNQFKGHI